MSAKEPSRAPSVAPRDESADRPRSAATLTEALRDPGALQRVLCASLAWSVTVAPAAFSHAGSTLARITAALAFLAALSGPVLAHERRFIGRHMGISAFLFFSLATWLLTPTAIDPARIDSVRAAIGAVAWGVFAFSWGEPWTGLGGTTRRNDADPFAAPLRARATLAPFAVPIASVGVVTALALLIGVWQIHETPRALIAQAAAVGLSVAVVSGGATLAISRGKDRPKGERKVNGSVIRALIALAVVAVLGAFLMALRP